MQKRIKASKVRLVDAGPGQAGSLSGKDVSEGLNGVHDLVILPESHQAIWFVGKDLMPYIAPYAWAKVEDVVALTRWLAGGDFTCEECGEPFANAQGLGKHRLVHANATALPAQPSALLKRTRSG
jgi:hypothetical protein